MMASGNNFPIGMSLSHFLNLLNLLTLSSVLGWTDKTIPNCWHTTETWINRETLDMEKEFKYFPSMIGFPWAFYGKLGPNPSAIIFIVL